MEDVSLHQDWMLTCLGRLQIPSSPCDLPSGKSSVFSSYLLISEVLLSWVQGNFCKMVFKVGIYCRNHPSLLARHEMLSFHTSSQLSPPTFSCLFRFWVPELPCQFLWLLCFVLFCSAITTEVWGSSCKLLCRRQIH